MQDRAARNLPKSYVALWAALGVVAAGYLLVIGTHPNQISQLLGTPRGTETAEADPAGDGTASARIESLLRQIAGLEQDRTALRQELARRTDHEANLTQRLAALETREPSDATPATGIRLLATIPAESPAPAATGKSGARAIDGKAAEAAAAKEALRKTAAKPTAAVAKPAAGGLSEVERLADRVIVLETGRIVADQTPAALIERFGRANLEEVFLDIARRERAEGGSL